MLSPSSVSRSGCSRLPPQNKAAQQQYLTTQEEKALVTYVLQCAENGFPLPVKALRRLAWVVKRHRVSVSLPSVGDDTLRPPGKNWPQALYSRHPELRARRLKPIDWTRSDENIYNKVRQWFELISKQLADPAILPENVYNMDETGVLLGQSTTLKMLVHRDTARRTRGTGLKRVLVTAIECISAAGDALPPLIIWPASTHRSVWNTHPTPGWHFACSKNGYTDKHISLCWIKYVFDPLTREKAGGKPRLLINDGFATHESVELLQFCFEKNIILCRLPSHTSHKLQPLDVGVFGPLKTAYREQVEQLYRGGSGTVGKQHFTLLYSRARVVAFTESNILSAWSKAGLRPLDANRVLGTISGPPANQPTAQIATPQPSLSFSDVTQATPVTSEGFIALRRLIEGEFQHVSELNQHRMQKAFNAAEQAMIERTLLRDRTQELFQQNCEKKTRTSVKSTIVGTARVMSYEDIVDRQSEKKATSTSKVTQGGIATRKRRAPATEQASNKRSRQAEAQQAVRYVDSSHMQRFCHVFELQP